MKIDERILAILKTNEKLWRAHLSKKIDTNNFFNSYEIMSSLNNTFRKVQALSQVGSVESALLAFTGKPTTIDQEGLFRIKTVDSPSQKPVPRGTDIEIPLTDVNLDITQMNQSYFQIDVDI